jgi:hypothetical protein
VGRTEIYACGESVSRRNSSESEVLFSLKQEAPAYRGRGTFTNYTIMVLDNKTRLYICSVIHDNQMHDIKVHMEYLAASRFINMKQHKYTDTVDINFLPDNIRKQIDTYITLLSLKG